MYVQMLECWMLGTGAGIVVLQVVNLVQTRRLSQSIKRLTSGGPMPVQSMGRLPPTAAELAAARNRIDSSGIAHPGGT